VPINDNGHGHAKVHGMSKIDAPVAPEDLMDMPIAQRFLRLFYESRNWILSASSGARLDAEI
jgi:hypothetical protein